KTGEKGRKALLSRKFACFADPPLLFAVSQLTNSNRISLIFRATTPVACDSFFDSVSVMDTQLTYYGHSAFKLVTPRGNVLLIDPCLTNPLFEKGKDEISALKRVDLILLTHGHFDHVGDSVEIAKRTKAKLVATFDLSAAMKSVHGYPNEQADF